MDLTQNFDYDLEMIKKKMRRLVDKDDLIQEQFEREHEIKSEIYLAQKLF
jgi:hypothetical protein